MRDGQVTLARQAGRLERLRSLSVKICNAKGGRYTATGNVVSGIFRSLPLSLRCLTINGMIWEVIFNRFFQLFPADTDAL